MRDTVTHGSSPRTWGTPDISKIETGRIRFIPTHVGNTANTATSAPSSPVHPHARGEHRRRHGARRIPPRTWGTRARGIDTACGSSPRTWGTPPPAWRAASAGRFIPTHVGNTLGAGRLRSGLAVHPHARGEHYKHGWRRLRGTGSSPRTWGTRMACGTRLRKCSVHPHARGEHPSARPHASIRNGSSPRTWGTREGLRSAGQERRFIPTHVGNTPMGQAVQLGTVVHPHARGEHLLAGGRIFPDVRFIPTHVGNTWAGPRRRPTTTVHPHARGEHLLKVPIEPSASGSSPRTWGTLRIHRDQRTGDRFIPTHVGNTRTRRTQGRRRAVHPHARGEHVYLRAITRTAVRFIPTHVGNTPAPRLRAGERAVHPHARGEHVPPRMGAGAARRFIPTHVGNTRHAPSRAAS